MTLWWGGVANAQGIQHKHLKLTTRQGLMLMEGGWIPTIPFNFTTHLPTSISNSGDGVSLLPPVHDLWQQASLEDSHVSCPSLINFRGFLLPSVKSSNLTGMAGRAPQDLPFLALSSIISCYTSSHSFHLHLPHSINATELTFACT